ncbi:hypothetical protein NX059_008889 [Plenodomus lindquistii]|nr:hypothetical protein NX059_008889 [Plenodomus lindquistii]
MTLARDDQAQEGASLQAPTSEINELTTQESKTQANQRLSPLLRLPGEMRNRIYELVYDKAIVIVDTPTINALQPHAFTGFLLSCRQINHGATPLFYQHCIFDFADGLTESVIRRLGSEKLRLLRSIQFSTARSLNWIDRATTWAWKSKVSRLEFHCPALEHCHFVGLFDEDNGVLIASALI